MDSRGFELWVVNDAEVRIYPILKAGRHEEEFGVVAPKTHKSIGFTPFRIGEVLRVDWGEGHIDPKKTVTLQTKQYRGLKMRALWVIYDGDGKWSLKAFDENDKEIQPKPDEPAAK